MHGDDITPAGADPFAESLTAELASVAYKVALCNAGAGTWVDLELELWRVLGDVVRRRRQEWSPSIPSRVSRG
jgi:hypothetical protein